jgi:hypothetical protein
VTADGHGSLVRRLAGAIAWRVFVSTAYTAGLTLLIPVVALRIVPAELGRVPVSTSPVLLWLAVGLVAVALVVRLWVTRSLSGSLSALGWHTFVPGFVGLLLGLFGREPILARLARAVPRFDEVRPVAELYLDRVVPQVLYLTVGFFVAGILLLLLGSWLAPRPPGRA